MAISSIDHKRAKNTNTRSKLAVFSFKMMRKWVGILGISIGAILPIITYIVTECHIIQESISHYYFTIAGDVFVGLLCAVAFFLIMYPGDGKWEDGWTNLAGFLALGIAFFPTCYKQIDTICTEQSYIYQDWVPIVHFSCAAIFFIILGFVAFYQFPKKNSSPQRNLYYKICGCIMWLCIIFLAPMVFFEDYGMYLSENKFVFTAEVIALLAFGLSWLVKGYELEEMYQS